MGDQQQPNLARQGPISWMAGHGIAPHLLMIMIIIGGFFSSLMIRKEFLPPADADFIQVSVIYPGATPAEVEQSIALPIENQLSGIDSIAQLTARIQEGSATLFAELENGTNLDRAAQEISQAVSQVSTFPLGIEQPQITILGMTPVVMRLLIHGPVDPVTLKRLGDFVRERLLDSAEISRVDLVGASAEQIHVEINQQTLERYGLSLANVAQQIRSNALEQSAGAIQTDAGDILITLDDRLYFAEQFQRLPLINDASGVVLELGDIATIREGFSDERRTVTYEDEPSLRFAVYRTAQQTPLTVTRAVHDTIAELSSELPQKVQLVIIEDYGEQYQQRVGLLLKNAIIGLILVMILLSLFLQHRLAFWVTMGIPTSFLGALLLMPAFDVSINMISMFAFIVALGLVVDDAIIAGESIYHQMQKGKPLLDAAIVGAKEVAVPLSFAILTNIAAFMPLLSLPNVMGKLFFSIPVVVISCFIISWIEALFILPSHLAHIKVKDREHPNWLERRQRAVDAGLQRFINGVYQPLLRRVINWPSLTIAISLTTILIVFAIAASGRMGFSMMPRLEGQSVAVTATLPVDSSYDQALKIQQALDNALRQAVAPIEADQGLMLLGVIGSIEGNEVEVEGRLVDAFERPISANELVRLWRQQVTDLAGVESLSFDSERGGGPSSGASLSIELHGSRDDELEAASHLLTQQLKALSEVSDVTNGFTNGKAQWDIELNSVGRSLGLQAGDVANQLRHSLYGAQALRQQRGGNEVTLLVRLPEQDRQRASDIERLKIRTPAGAYVALAEIANVSKARAPSTIRRRNGQRYITISAEVEPRERIPSITKYFRETLYPELQTQYPSVSYEMGGRQRRSQETMSVLMLQGSLALFIIYALLAIPFRSYSQPLLVMALIPFGAAGAIVGHLVLGFGLSLLSMMGMVALTGIVVNDSLILIEYANRQRLQGLSTQQAIINAGMRRFRPILLTTLTTFFGLVPMVFETSQQARFILPMAISLGFGVLFTTFVCLLILPAFYIVLANFRQRFSPRERLALANNDHDEGVDEFGVGAAQQPSAGGSSSTLKYQASLPE